ncbi:hypothetical protein GCM10009549_19980 [Streptomyces thermoalcalitolerans]|uniref:Uncharacterized protein n=1 Tax=Streptomyces thermoalcalitolerans TaxID=65605 RepID=A0ABN1NL59_9ACTN
MHLRRADHLAVRHGDERPVMGLGGQMGEVVDERFGGDQQVGEGTVPDTGEALEVGSCIGTQVADDHSHGHARYGGGSIGRLPFSPRPFPGRRFRARRCSFPPSTGARARAYGTIAS